MSLTITNISSVPGVAPVKNPLIYEVNSDALIATPGVIAIRHIKLTANPNNNETLIYTIANGITVTFTFKTTPDPDNGLELPLGTYNDHAYLEELVELLQSNYIINKYYVVSVDGSDFIYLTARVSGAKYTTTATGTATFSTGQTAGVDEVLEDNFSIGCNIYAGTVEDDLVVNLTNAPSIEGDTFFDIAPHLLPMLNEPFLPDLGLSSVQDAGSIVQDYFLQFYEIYGTPPVAGVLHTVSGKKVFRGGRSLLSVSDYPDVVEDYLALGKWMSFQPTTRYVAADQLVFCNWLNFSVLTEFNLMVTVYYDDGTDKTTFPFVAQVILENTIACFPLGFDQLSLGTLESDKTALKYECTLQRASDSSVVGEKLTFNLDPNHYHERIFLYEGSLGTMETLRATGKKEHDVEVKKEMLTRILPFDFTSQTRQRKGVNHTYNESVKVSTGPMDLEALIAFKEFLVSEFVYVLQGGSCVPIEIEPGTFKLYTDDEADYAVEFSYYESMVVTAPNLLQDA